MQMASRASVEGERRGKALPAVAQAFCGESLIEGESNDGTQRGQGGHPLKEGWGRRRVGLQSDPSRTCGRMAPVQGEIRESHSVWAIAGARLNNCVKTVNPGAGMPVASQVGRRRSRPVTVVATG